jgi:adenosylcobinamide-phosphate synthase
MRLTFLILFLALVADRLIGDPDRLWRAVPHPVALFGRAIGWADKRFNDNGAPPEARRRSGAFAALALLVAAAAAGVVLEWILRWIPGIGLLAEIAVVAVFLAQKSLADHVRRVADALRADGLAGGRKAVSMIVGRDPERLDEADVCRAAIESLAENASDGVVAPAFWYALLGLPGLFAYKMLNTADSMIGHRTERHVDFGRFAARADDVANWIPARLTGALIVLAAWLVKGGAAGRRAWRTMMRDARLHRSPNAGWPEAAMGGALGVALAGPRIYAGYVVNDAMLNGAGRRAATTTDIDAALGVFWMACTLLAVIAAAVFVAG